MACGKLARSSLTHLCPSVLFVGNKTVSLGAVRHIVTSHPLVRVLPTLSSNAWHSSKPSQINLKPLTPVTPFSTPRPSKPPNAPLTEPGVPRRAVVVVERGSSYQLVRYTTVFQANRNITFACKGKKKGNSWNIKFQHSKKSFAHLLNSLKSVSKEQQWFLMKRPHQNSFLTMEMRNKAFFVQINIHLLARLDNVLVSLLLPIKIEISGPFALTTCATIQLKSHRDMRTPATGVDFYESCVQWWIKGMRSKAILVEVSSKSLRYNDIKEKNQ